MLTRVFFNNRDIFQKFYSKYLARRLIYGTSVSDDSETGVLSSLKQACGYEYTTKLMRMFTDMTQGEEVNVKFQEFVAASNGSVSTDGVGFSGNPKLGLSKPRAASARFVAGGGLTPVTVRMNYRRGLFGFGPLKAG